MEIDGLEKQILVLRRKEKKENQVKLLLLVPMETGELEKQILVYLQKAIHQQ